MIRHIGLVPRNRLQNIPLDLRAKHEYCFFLHDQCVQMLKDYEEAEANIVTVEFQSKISTSQFLDIAKLEDSIQALIRTGYPEEAKKVILNSITMGMVSDCLHHLFEGLKCLEKRKSIVALNILRKPLKSNLLYLAWMLGDDSGFYKNFMTGNPEELAQKKLGNMRIDILAKAIKKTELDCMVNAEILNEIIFDRRSERGLEQFFQHAVHLITVQHLELRTSPQNFNFIFKDPVDDDIYYLVYEWMPYILLFLSHVIAGLFNKMKKMSEGSSVAFYIRTVHGFILTENLDSISTIEMLKKMLSKDVVCDNCGSKLKVTYYNATRILLTESFRCTSCRHFNALPFSWIF